MSRKNEGVGTSFYRLDSLNGTRELQLLADISRQLQTMDDLPQQLSFILHNLRSIISFDQAALYLFNRSEKSLRCQASAGMNLEEIEQAEKNAARGYPGWVMRSHQALVLPDIEEEANGMRYGADHGGSMALVPVISGDRTIGVVSVASRTKNAFAQWETFLLALFANQVALAMENASRSAAIQAREKKYESVLDHAGIPFCAFRSDGVLLETNRSFLDLIGVESKNHALQLNLFADILHMHGRSLSLRHVLEKNNSATDFEALVRRRGGGERSVWISCTPSGETGHAGAAGYACVMKESADNLRWTEEWVRVQKMASLGSLTSGVAHDFNNLLSGIMGCASLILSDMDPSSPNAEDMRIIMAASQKASELARQLLSYGKGKPAHKPVSVNDMVSEVLKILSRTMDKGIHIKTYFFPGVSPVEGDATRIQQAFMNVCLNARDAMPHGGEVVVETENVILDGEYSKARMDLEPGDYVVIRIRDTGMGMDSRTLKRIFEPFFTTKESGKGSGLGLAIAQEIVMHHGGRIFVHSKIHKGTSFEIVLPAAAARADVSPAEGLHGRRETLLLVDDEEAIRRMGKRML